jgi:hypothetical protein
MTAISGSNIYLVKYLACAPPSQPGAISGNTNVCSGVSNNYSIATVVGATSYSWSLPSGWAGSSTSNTIAANAGSSGTILVSVTNSCGTSPQQTISITVNPLPTITVNSGSICSGQSFTITPVGANTYSYIGGGPVVSPTMNLSYSVTGTSTAGCTSSSTVVSTVTVYALPSLTLSSSDAAGLCIGQTATLTVNGANSYSWSSGSTANTVAVSPSVTTNYTVTGTNANGCSSSSVISQIAVDCTGLEELASMVAGLSVYPNPVNDLLIAGKTTHSEITVKVFNMVGELVYSDILMSDKTRIDLNDLSGGIYFVAFYEKNRMIKTVKIVKETENSRK